MRGVKNNMLATERRMQQAELLRSLRQVPKLLKVLLAVAFIGAIAILVLRLWPEQIELGKEIGDMLSTMCLAYVGGFITSFLWNHFRRMSDLERAAKLRKSAIRFMAAGHNCFFDFIISGMGSSPFDCEDYSLIPDDVLERKTRERWEEYKKDLLPESHWESIRTYQEDALCMFKEHFEIVDPFMSQFHPTFVLALNRIRRELDKRIIVGSNGVPAPGHELSGALIQFSALRNHIKWLREVDVQIDKEADHDFLGAIPRFTKDELIARGVPKVMLDRMERGEL